MPLQEWIHKFTEGSGNRFLQLVLVLFAMVGLTVWYDAAQFKNLSSIEGMDAAQVARNVAELHSAKAKVSKDTALTEKGEMVKGRGDTPNEHDILTGSDPAGMYSTAGGDTTCGNWAKSGEGSAIVGHHDLQGLKDTRHMKSWNSSHGSRGCSQDQLKASGGAGLFYCFAAK